MSQDLCETIRDQSGFEKVDNCFLKALRYAHGRFLHRVSVFSCAPKAYSSNRQSHSSRTEQSVAALRANCLVKRRFSSIFRIVLLRSRVLIAENIRGVARVASEEQR